MKKGKNIAFLTAVLLASFAVSFSGLKAFAEGENAETLIAPQESSNSAVKDCLSANVDTLDFGELAEGGRSYTKGFLVKNNCSEDFEITAKLRAYDGPAEINNEYKIADEWLAFVGGKTDYVVPANGESDIKLRVFLPNSVKGASYYAAVGLQLKDEPNSSENEVVNVRMDVTSSGFSRSGAVASNYAQALGFGGAVRAGVKLKNTGTAGYLSKYVLERGSLFGSDDYEKIAEDSKEVPAGADAEFYAGNYTENRYGIYRVRQTVTAVNSDGESIESVLEQTVINIPLVAVFIAGGALIALFSLIIVVKIMKHRKAEEKEDKKKDEKESDNEL